MIEITISEILDLLEQGKKRKEIAEHFGISKYECSKLFQHPKLKGKRPKKVSTFKLIDDIEDVQEIENTENVEGTEMDDFSENFEKLEDTPFNQEKLF